MAIKFTTTEGEATHCMVCVYGRSGAGKTTLIKTCPRPIIITSENKLFALRKENIPAIVIKNAEDFNEAIDYCLSKKGRKKFETICLDSISDLPQTILNDLKKGVNDQRQAYGQMNDIIMEAMDRFKEVTDQFVYVIAKGDKIDDEGVMKQAIQMPGARLKKEMNYYFDFVFCLDVKDDPDNPYRMLITQPTYKADAKGCKELDDIEEPHLGKIFKKALA